MKSTTGRHKVAGMTALWLCGLLATVAQPVAAQTPPAAEPAHEQSHWDLIVRSEIVIDRPPADVWPIFLDTDHWMHGMRSEHVSGTAGAEGEVRGIHKNGNSGLDYYIKTVAIGVGRRYAVKIISNDGALIGFANFSFLPEGGKTHLIYDVFLEYPRPAGGGIDEQREHAKALASFDANNARLKAMVEAHR